MSVTTTRIIDRLHQHTTYSEQAIRHVAKAMSTGMQPVGCMPCCASSVLCRLHLTCFVFQHQQITHKLMNRLWVSLHQHLCRATSSTALAPMLLNGVAVLCCRYAEAAAAAARTQDLRTAQAERLRGQLVQLQHSELAHMQEKYQQVSSIQGLPYSACNSYLP